MIRLFVFSFFVFLLSVSNAAGQEFSSYFEDRTLRVDYTFSGDTARQDIYVDELCSMPHWYGKRHRLAEVPLKGNGQIIVRDRESQQVIYRHSFSTLFQEWLATDEAKHTSKSFENVFLVPYPKQPVDITVELYDYHDRINATMKHTVDPNDILIRHIGEENVTPYVTLHPSSPLLQQGGAGGGSPIHIAFVAEGYQGSELQTYLDDCRKAVKALFEHEPFRSLQDRFNIIALLSTSRDSGVSVPREGIWKNTILGSHFDTFYTDRYLTTLHLKRLHDVLAGTPYEHIIILTNTTTYGGGGIYNSYNLASAHGPKYEPVVVHEFGHSFGGLADESVDEDLSYGSLHRTDYEPLEPNITNRVDFSRKWASMLPQGTAIPTPPDASVPRDQCGPLGLYEGAGYASHGVYRPTMNCMMRNYAPFCPVCTKRLEEVFGLYTK